MNSIVRAATAVTVAVVVSLATANTATPAVRPYIDSTRLVVQLVPLEGGAATAWTSGKSGRDGFDRTLAALGVNEARPLFVTGFERPEHRTHATTLRLADFAVIDVPDGAKPDELRAGLARLPDVLEIGFDAIAYIAGTHITPNDPYFNTHQYSLGNTGVQPPYDPGTAGADSEMEAAWAFTTGDSSVIIGIIDTGVDIGHPDLSEKIWTNPLEDDDLVDSDGNGYVDDFYGYDFANNDNLPLDDHQHGTHLAGIAGAVGNNGIGIAGMNWHCKIMAVKVLDMNGSGTFTAIAQGVKYAVDMGADIINLSLGGPSDQMSLKTAIDYAIAAGVIVCAATGNDNSGDFFYPAAYDSVMAVGATDSRDRRAIGDLCPFDVAGSNFGPWIDVCAAGDVVWSTFPLAFGNYGAYCLTSMAAPHVAGLASLVLALRPGMSADSVAHYVRRGAEDEVGHQFEDTPGFDIYHGWGRINGRITLQALVVVFPPILEVPGAQEVVELDTLTFAVSAVDSNLTDPVVAVSTSLPYTFTHLGGGEWQFVCTPGTTDAGLHSVEFVVTDADGNSDSAIVAVTIIDGCACVCHNDPVCDAVSSNVQDVVATINVAFRSGAALIDPNANCPYEQPDVNCDTFTSVLDVVLVVNVAFRGFSPATTYCVACP